MNRSIIQAILFLSLSPLLAAQQPAQSAQALQITGSIELTHAAQKPVEERPLTDADRDRGLILNQKDWEKLGLTIIATPRYDNPGIAKPRPAELQLQINRVVFTHIHTYVLTDKSTGVVLAAGRVRAFDGVVASGPMAEQIVKILSAARLPARPASGE